LIGTAGNSTTQVDSPRFIAFDSNPNIFYVSEANNNRVMRYTLNSTVGTLVAGGNAAGTNSTQLNSPRGLCFDSSTNSLLIANSNSHNVVRWIIGASSWVIFAGNSNGVSGNGPTGLYYPWDVKIDPMGNIYIVDRDNDRIQFFRAGQTNGTTIAGVSGVTGTSSLNLNQPLGIALDSQYNLYVSDTYNNRIQQFLRY
jgi:sugar lactone lactonase YvrE